MTGDVDGSSDAALVEGEPRRAAPGDEAAGRGSEMTPPGLPAEEEALGGLARRTARGSPSAEVAARGGGAMAVFRSGLWARGRLLLTERKCADNERERAPLAGGTRRAGGQESGPVRVWVASGPVWCSSLLFSSLVSSRRSS